MKGLLVLLLLSYKSPSNGSERVQMEGGVERGLLRVDFDSFDCVVLSSILESESNIKRKTNKGKDEIIRYNSIYQEKRVIIRIGIPRLLLLLLNFLAQALRDFLKPNRCSTGIDKLRESMIESIELILSMRVSSQSSSYIMGNVIDVN